MVKYIDGNFEIDKDFSTEEDVIVTGDIRSKDRGKFDFSSQGVIRAMNIYSVNVGAQYILAYGLHVHDIFSTGTVHAVDVYANNIDVLSITAYVIDAEKIFSAEYIRAYEIKANNITSDFIICSKRIKKKPDAKTVAKVFIENTLQLKRQEHTSKE